MITTTEKQKILGWAVCYVPTKNGRIFAGLKSETIECFEHQPDAIKYCDSANEGERLDELHIGYRVRPMYSIPEGRTLIPASNIVLALMLFLCSFGFSQQLIIKPIGIPSGAVIVPNAKLEAGIVNNGPEPVNFFQLDNESGREYKYLNDSTRLTSIIPDFTGDSISFLKQLLMNDATIYKSTKFKNTHLVYDPFDAASESNELLSMQLSPIAGDRLPYLQCYQYALKVGYNAGRIVGVDRFSQVSFSAHTVLSAKILEEKTLWDADPGTIGFVQPDLSKASGLLSIEDAVADPLKITEPYAYTMPDGTDTVLAYWQTIPTYRNLFTPQYQEWQLSASQPIYVADGTNTLCAGCSVALYSYVYEKMMLDMDNPQVSMMMNTTSAQQWYAALQQGGSNALIAADSISQALSAITSVPKDSISKWLLSGNISAYSSSVGWAPTFDDNSYYNQFRFYEITVPANHTDTIHIGKNKDLYFGYFVHRIEATGGNIVLKDSAITSAQYDLYNLPNNYSPKCVTLLDRGFIPPQVGAKIYVYYNHLMNQHEITNTSFVEFGTGGNLSSYEKVVMPEIASPVTAISDVYENSFTIYPNPCSSHTTIESPEVGIATLSTIDGRILEKLSVGQGKTQIAMPYQPGIYFFTLSGTTRKIVRK